MKPGHYTLKATIFNPRPDRRKPRDFRYAEKWPEGLRVVLTAGWFNDDGEAREAKAYGYHRYITKSDTEGRWEALVAALEPVKDDVRSIENDTWEGISVDVLQHLVDAGDVPIERVRALAMERVFSSRSGRDPAGGGV